ncbi:MAG: hypothetical protein EPO07_06330 [Verrucomicrobia bacterium]|nr:MAG: hypothetical protein EPO07_06330 [Verrucomicrobiota bacterium]
MTSELSTFAARLRERILSQPRDTSLGDEFGALALELFGLQFAHNSAYRKICEARRLIPATINNWTQIPAVPAAAFKELELTSLPRGQRTHVFHSSGTTEQRPSRHFHNAESLALYEASLWSWFQPNVLGGFQFSAFDFQLLLLTPPPELAPHSSLVHMFEVARQKLGAKKDCFVGRLDANGAWELDCEAVLDATRTTQHALLLLGTAFAFVHLLDYMAERNLHLQLPPGSRVMETGGYKGRSRELPKAELHALITERLGVPAANILCEYGMSELGSQAYDTEIYPPSSILHPRCFRFPPWARVQIISPETGREVAEGEAGLIRVFDLANVFSVFAIQTEDLAIRRGDGFELLGRAALAEPRGCSLMTA